MVSILCATYNHEKYIEQALNSLINQDTNFRFEVIVHDDASNDNTPKIIQKYQNLYPEIIKPIFQNENKYSKNINIYKEYIYPKASGKYIAFCEGDDFWIDDTKLQKQVDALEENETCSICVAKVRTTEEDGITYRGSLPGENDSYDEIISQENIIDLLFIDGGGYPFHTTSYLIRRTAIEKIPVDLRWKIWVNTDQAILRMAANAGDYYYIDEELSVFRKNSVNSLSNRWKGYTGEKKIELYEQWTDTEFYFDIASEKRWHRKIIVKLISNIIAITLESNNLLLARKWIKKYQLKIKDVDLKVVGLKQGIKYIIFLLFPWTLLIRYNRHKTK